MRIARDLHDAAGHGVTAISLQASTGLRAIDDGADVDEARAVLEEIKRTSRIALEDMRKLLGLLRPAGRHISGARPGSASPTWTLMIEECRAAGLDVTLTRSGEPHTLPPLLDQAAYRIIQEALTNALKHAGSGASATVGLSFDPTSVELQVTDDGHGSIGSVAVGTRRGLIGMRERVELFGGRFSAGRWTEAAFASSPDCRSATRSKTSPRGVSREPSRLTIQVDAGPLTPSSDWNSVSTSRISRSSFGRILSASSAASRISSAAGPRPC